MGFYLRKKVTGHVAGRAGPGWAGLGGVVVSVF